MLFCHGVQHSLTNWGGKAAVTCGANGCKHDLAYDGVQDSQLFEPPFIHLREQLSSVCSVVTFECLVYLFSLPFIEAVDPLQV